ncbi:MAG: hypothetical protein AAGA75_03055 [Cyanobacteria bacterium P01_E01_bin.6]
MAQSIGVVCGFLGGTIISVEGGYRVLQHPRPDHIFARISDARWFLAITWCDQWPASAGILNHEGDLSFQNEAALAMGETIFLPPNHRKKIFERCLSLDLGESTTYTIQSQYNRIEILGLQVDPRYGRVAVLRSID